MILLTKRILHQCLGIRGAASAPKASVAYNPSSLVHVQHRVVGAAIHSQCSTLDNVISVDDPIQSANNRLMKYHSRSRWKQQRRLFAHQTDSTDNKVMTDATPQEMATLQSKLYQEASYLTRTLYRKCLQSTKILGKGNERDEDDFAAREDEELNGGVNLERISMAPPVSRENELSSRENYYKQFTREHFDGHWSLLGAHGFHIGDEGNMRHGLGNGGQQDNQYQGGHHHLGGQMSAQYQGSGNGALKEDCTTGNSEYYMWKEDQVEKFVYLIKSGEERRQWVLDDYEFEDSLKSRQDGVDGWPRELKGRLETFEENTGALIKEMYRRKGWTHSSDINNNDDAGDFFSDSDSDDDT